MFDNHMIKAFTIEKKFLSHYLLNVFLVVIYIRILHTSLSRLTDLWIEFK